MRNSKKFLTLVLAVLMMMSTFAFSTPAATFTDVTIDNKALYQATGLLSDLGVTKGTTDTTFTPATPVTREQMSAFVYRLMKAGKSVEGGTNSSTFTDLTDPTFYFMISWANNQGIIKGRSDSVFDPKGGITLQDAYTMIIRALGYEKKEILPYPYGFIDEAETLGLDENLPSALKYTDTLTRGDIAIILYNAFFADMAEGETSYKTSDAVGSDGTSIMTPVTTYKTVAEKIFGVTKDTQRVIATPNYYLNDATIDSNFDTDTLLFKGTAGYRTFEELGLTGKADDYFLSDFTLYLKDVKKADGTIETKVLYAEPLLTKKTVTKATVGKVTPVKSTDYYAPDTKSYAKGSGLLTIDGAKTYLYNAPFSYSKPQITSDIASKPSAYYEALNSKDVNFIGLAPETDEGVSHFITSDYNLELDAQGYDILGLPQKELYGTYADGTTNVNVYTYTANAFTNALNQVYNEGYYEMDTYDSDSDGIIDYIWYKPYTFGQAIKDEDNATLTAHGIDSTAPYAAIESSDSVPTIYTFDATISGVTFKDKDFVIAYVNGPANYIKVAAVVDSAKAEIKSYNSSSYNVVLKSGTTINTYGTSRLLAYFQGSADPETGDLGEAFASTPSFSDLYDAAYLGTEKIFYAYGGRLLYTKLVSNPVLDVTKDTIIIPQTGVTKPGSATENGYLVTRPVLTAYVSGNTSGNVIIPVEVEGNTPATVYDPVTDSYNFGAYAQKICTSTSDTDGIYKLIVAINSENTGAAAETAMASTELDSQYGIAATDLIFSKVTGTTYEFINPLTNLNANILPNGALYASVQPYTKIIIRSRSEDSSSYVYTEFSANKLPSFANKLQNIQLILLNNPTSTRTEYIAALYATTEFPLDNVSDVVTSESARIVKTNGTIDIDSAGVYHYYYDVYNPFTGAIESNIPGFRGSTNASSLSSAATIGKFYEVVDGVLQDKVTTSSLNGATIFPASGTLTRTALNPTPSNLAQVASYSDGELEIKGDSTIYKTDSDTKVIMIEAGGTAKNDFKWGTATAKTVADLGSDSVSLRNYCITTNPDTSRITTTYADNLEVFYTIDTNKVTTGYKVVDFVVILRDKVSDAAFLNSND